MATTFCPCCASLLVPDNKSSALLCDTCPYKFGLGKKYFQKKDFSAKQKQVADVLGGPEAWKDVEKMQTDCPACGHDRAYFRQMQTRSADEPMTMFYKCEKCGQNWKED